MALNHALRLGSGLINHSGEVWWEQGMCGAAMNPSPEPLVRVQGRLREWFVACHVPSEANGTWSGRPDLNRRPRGPKPRALASLRYAPVSEDGSMHRARGQTTHVLHPAQPSTMRVGMDSGR